MAVILIHTYRSIHIYIKYAHEMYAKASRVLMYGHTLAVILIHTYRSIHIYIKYAHAQTYTYNHTHTHMSITTYTCVHRCTNNHTGMYVYT